MKNVSIKIEIKLFGVFRIGRFKKSEFEYPINTKVRDVVIDLQLTDNLLGTVLINEIHSDVNAELNDGDSLSLLPILGGG